MKLNRKISILFIILILVFSVAFSFYYLFVIQRTFIQRLDNDTKKLNDLIVQYEHLEKELNSLKNEINSDSLRVNIYKYFSSNNLINRTFEKNEFLALLRDLLNSRSVLISQLKVKVNTTYPFVFDEPKKLTVSFYLKVGDTIE
ncbi:MAG: hypothetical protein PWP02_492 [Thermosipho sp. (in: thermotogales)]|nr:hypothetical protein [Thermosipho sp. (in: thermotogales)]